MKIKIVSVASIALQSCEAKAIDESETKKEMFCCEWFRALLMPEMNCFAQASLLLFEDVVVKASSREPCEVNTVSQPHELEILWKMAENISSLLKFGV